MSVNIASIIDRYGFKVADSFRLHLARVIVDHGIVSVPEAEFIRAAWDEYLASLPPPAVPSSLNILKMLQAEHFPLTLPGMLEFDNAVKMMQMVLLRSGGATASLVVGFYPMSKAPAIVHTGDPAAMLEAIEAIRGHLMRAVEAAKPADPS